MTDKKLSVGEVERAVARTAPDHIYLVIGGECPDEANFSELEEVTWCEDDVDGSGIQYVRATLSQQPEFGKAQSQQEEAPAPYGWVAAGSFFTSREQATIAAEKTPCVEVYSRQQVLAILARSAERQGVAEELARQPRQSFDEQRTHSPDAGALVEALVDALETSNLLLRTKRHACESTEVCHVLDSHIKRNSAALAAYRAQGKGA